jgi:hypothetical protein
MQLELSADHETIEFILAYGQCGVVELRLPEGPFKTAVRAWAEKFIEQCYAECVADKA